MTLDDIRKLATGSILFSLDRIISPRLIRIFYFLGMATIFLWAISHFFWSFSQGLVEGLWGLLQIAVFGLLGFVSLRIICEAILVYFKVNESVASTAVERRVSANLIDDVREAIEQLAEEDDDGIATLSGPRAESVTGAPVRKGPVRRTAKRSPGSAKVGETGKSSTSQAASASKPTTSAKPAPSRKGGSTSKN